MESLLSDLVKGTKAFDVSGAHACILRKIRNLGRPGITSMAISAVDNALWDLKSRLIGVSLLDLLGAARESAMIYGSGGFTSYSIPELQKQLGDWAAQGIRMVKMKIDRAPAGMNIVAGEYGYDVYYFRRMLAAGAVDVLQADATRCGGITGFMRAGTLCEAFELPFSFHCAPALHLAAACALPAFWVGEYFFDHARIENMFFAGVPQPINGALRPDRSRPGCGLEFKRADAAPFAL